MSAEARVKRVVTVQDAQEILRRYGYGHHADALDSLIPKPPTEVDAPDRGMTAEEKVIYILRRSFHETPNDAAMIHIARAIIGALAEPPTDDEREALDSVIRDALAPLHIDYRPWHRIVTVLLDAILASAPWRNRGRGPITDDMVAAAVQAYREQSFSTYVNRIYMRAALEAARNAEAVR